MLFPRSNKLVTFTLTTTQRCQKTLQIQRLGKTRQNQAKHLDRTKAPIYAVKIYRQCMMILTVVYEKIDVFWHSRRWTFINSGCKDRVPGNELDAFQRFGIWT